MWCLALSPPSPLTPPELRVSGWCYPRDLACFQHACMDALCLQGFATAICRAMVPYQSSRYCALLAYKAQSPRWQGRPLDVRMSKFMHAKHWLPLREPLNMRHDQGVLGCAHARVAASRVGQQKRSSAPFSSAMSCACSARCASKLRHSSVLVACCPGRHPGPNEGFWRWGGGRGAPLRLARAFGRCQMARWSNRRTSPPCFLLCSSCRLNTCSHAWSSSWALMGKSACLDPCDSCQCWAAAIETTTVAVHSVSRQVRRCEHAKAAGSQPSVLQASPGRLPPLVSGTATLCPARSRPPR